MNYADDSHYQLQSPNQNQHNSLLLQNSNDFQDVINNTPNSFNIRQQKLSQRNDELMQRSALQDDGGLILFEDQLEEDKEDQFYQKPNSLAFQKTNTDSIPQQQQQQLVISIHKSKENIEPNITKQNSNSLFSQKTDQQENNKQHLTAIQQLQQIEQASQNQVLSSKKQSKLGSFSVLNNFLQKKKSFFQTEQAMSLKDSKASKNQKELHITPSQVNEAMNEKKKIEQLGYENQFYFNNNGNKVGLQNSIKSILQITQLLKFCKTIREYSITYGERIFNEKPNIALIIADKSYIQKETSKFKALLKYQPKVIHPHTKFYIVWSFFKLIFILQGIYLAALEITFNFDTSIEDFDWYIYAFLLSFFDMVITFNVGVYIEGSIIVNRKKIAQFYLKHTFWIDLFGTISFILQKVSGQNFFLLLFFIRVFQIQGILNHIDNVYQLQQRFVSAYELIKLLIINCYVAHFMACVFYQIAVYEHQYDPTAETWIKSRGIETLSWSEQYTESLYFSFITMSTVGYGDISPTTTIEKQIAIILTLISCGIFAYSVSTIGDIFRQISIRSATLKMKKFQVSQYMVKRHINKANQMQVIKSLEYMDQQVEKGNIKGLEILQQMQKNIQEEIFLDYFSSVLLQSQLIKHGKYSLQFVKSLAIKMNEITTAPDQIIYQQNQFNPNFYFLMEGSLIVYYQSEENNENAPTKEVAVIKQFQEGFGYQLLYSKEQSFYSIKSEQVCRLAYFSHQDFFDTLKQFPLDYERYQLISEQIEHYQKPVLLKCFYCQSKAHSMKNCVQVHFKRKTNQLIGRYNRPWKQKRNRTLDKDQSIHSLMDLDYVREELMKIRTNIVSQYLDKQLLYNINSRDIDFYYDFPKINLKPNGQIHSIGKTDTDEEELETYHFNENGLLERNLMQEDFDRDDEDEDEENDDEENNDIYNSGQLKQSANQDTKQGFFTLQSLIKQHQKNTHKEYQQQQQQKKSVKISQEENPQNTINQSICNNQTQRCKEGLSNYKCKTKNNNMQDSQSNGQLSQTSIQQQIHNNNDNDHYDFNKVQSFKQIQLGMKYGNNFENQTNFKKDRKCSILSIGQDQKQTQKRASQLMMSAKLVFQKGIKVSQNEVTDKLGQNNKQLVYDRKDQKKQTNFQNEKESRDSSQQFLNVRENNPIKLNLIKNLNKNILDTDNNIKLKEPFYIINLDRLKVFTIFLPNENVHNILSNFKRKQYEKMLLEKELEQAQNRISKSQIGKVSKMIAGSEFKIQKIQKLSK